MTSRVSHLSTASITDNPAEPSAVQPHNKEKHVARKSFSPTPFTVLNEDLQPIADQLADHERTLLRIRYTLQWHMPATTELVTDVSAVKGKLITIASRLHDDGEKDLRVASLVENSQLPVLFRRVQELALDCFLMKESVPSLSALTENDELENLYQDFRVLLADIYSEQIDTFVKTADLIMHKYVQTLDAELARSMEGLDQETRQEQVRRVDDLIDGLKDIRPKLYDRVEDRCKAVMRKDIFSLMLRLCHRIADTNNQNPKISTWRLALLEFLGEVVMPRYLSAASDDLLDQQRAKGNGKYGFQKYLGWWEPAGSKTLGLRLENEVGLRLEGVIVSLKTWLTEICQGRTDRYVNQVLEACICTLDKKFTDIFVLIAKEPYDSLRPALFDYIYGLLWGFREARGLYTLATSCSGLSKAAVLHASRELQAFFTNPNSPITDLLAPLDASDAAKREARGGPNDEFDGYFSRQLICIREVHAHKDDVALTLTAAEQDVPRALFAKEELLSDVPVMGYLSKRILRFLFLTAPVHDMELELVLRYYGGRLPPEVQALVERYNGVYKRTDAVNELALEVAHLNALAQKSYDLDAYVEAWQRLFEYKQKYTKLGCKEMYEMLAGLQDKLKSYTSIELEQVASSTVDSWTVNSPKSFFTELQRVSVDRQYGFTSVCMKVLCGCLFAKDLQEQFRAQQILNLLRQTEDYKPYVAALPEDVKRLIRENEADKIVTGARNVPAIDAAFSPLVLAKLLQGGRATDAIIGQLQDNWDDFECERWMRTVQLLARNNPLANQIEALNKQ